MKDEKEMIIVPAVDRALDVIELLSEKKEPMLLKDMADELGIPTASLFRIVKNLSARGYLFQASQYPLKYTIGYKILQLASKHEKEYSVAELVRPYMEALSKKSNQTSQFAVYRGGEFLYIEQVLSSAPVNYIARLYTPMPANTSAGAKCIAAQMKEEQKKDFLKQVSLEEKTEHSITDKSEFEEELRKTRTRGYGVDNEEFSIGIGCIAVPVFGSEGECVGALGITGHMEGYRDKGRVEELRDMVIQAGKAVSKELENKKHMY